MTNPSALMPEVRLTAAAMDRLMPMHLLLSPKGVILSCGATLRKLDPSGIWVGRRFFDLFTLRRPGCIRSLPDLSRHAGQRIKLALRDGSQTGLRGTAVPLADGQGLLLNLSFGVTVLDAVRRHRLTEADFAATDLAVELLYMVEVKTALTEDLRSLNHQLEGAKTVAEEEAQTDTLTGLRNRRTLDAVLGGLIGSGRPFALMHLDLDFFKAVNDTLGHAAGDFVLRRVARILTSETRESDTVARIGGDEFVIVMPGVTAPNRLRGIAARIIAELSRPMDYDGHPCRISASIGMTVSLHYERPSAKEMIADADMALYASKRAGRGRARLFQMVGMTRAAAG